MVGGAVLAGAALVEGRPNIAWTARFIPVLANLGLVATAATTLAWFVGAQRCPLSSLTVWMFLIPIFGLLFSMWVAMTRPDVPGAGPPGHLHAAVTAQGHA